MAGRFSGGPASSRLVQDGSFWLMNSPVSTPGDRSGCRTPRMAASRWYRSGGARPISQRGHAPFESIEGEVLELETVEKQVEGSDDRPVDIASAWRGENLIRPSCVHRDLGVPSRRDTKPIASVSFLGFRFRFYHT